MRPEPDSTAGQAAFAAALAGAAVPEGLTAPDPTEVARRFAVYRNNVHYSLGRALAARFPVVAQLVGATFFAALARVVLAAAPPRDPVLMHWGAALPDFLDGFEPIAHLPWLGDVARLEWARGVAVHAADATPADPAALAGPAPERLRLRLHPSVALFASAHPAVAIWQAHQPGASPAPLPPGPSHALIGRQPDFTVIVAPIDAPTHAVLAALAAGETLGAAATRGEPTPALALLLRHGLITAIETGDPA
jgi:hypothetical protein